MKYRKHYFNSPYFWHKALNLLLARYLLGQVSKLFNTLVLNAQDLLGEAVNFEGVMAEEREKRAHDSGSSPLSLQARWWAEARPSLREPWAAVWQAPWLPGEQFTTALTLNFVMKQKIITPLEAGCLGFIPSHLGVLCLANNKDWLKRKTHRDFNYC